MSSSSTDYAPNTPTFTFLKATYTSNTWPLRAWRSTPTARRREQLLLSLTGAYGQEAALIKKYDEPKYITGLTAQSAQSIPFISYGNKYFVVGASYGP